MLIGGLGFYALSKNDSDSLLPALLAGGAGLLALLILFSQDKIEREEIEEEINKKINDPVQLGLYRQLLDDEELLETLRETA